METLKTIRMQLNAVEEAFRERRLRDVIETLVSVHDLVDVLASVVLSEQLQAVRRQLDSLAAIGLVVADLDAMVEAAQSAPVPADAAALIEKVWRGVEALLLPAQSSTRLLLRTNVFPRGKKIFLDVAPTDTLKQVANLLKSRYASFIAAHLQARGGAVVVPEAVDILFYGSKVWENPDESLLPEYARVGDLVKTELDGVLWFPVLPGDSPVLFNEDDEDGEEGMMSLLENFTIEADISHLESEVQRMARSIHTEPVPTTGWRSRAYLIKNAGSEKEERIPLLGSAVTLGRGRENDIQILNDIKVSRFHCRITREDDNYFLEDNSSSNGTLVNGEMISRRQLFGGEDVELGHSTFMFVSDPSDGP